MTTFHMIVYVDDPAAFNVAVTDVVNDSGMISPEGRHMDKEAQRLLIAEIERIRDEQRPDIEDVARVLGNIFKNIGHLANVAPVMTGPDMWSWQDRSRLDSGFERWFVLSRSTMENAEGFPLLTIREAVAPRLDAWLTLSTMIMGRDETTIRGSIAVALSNQIGAIEGLHSSVKSMSETLTVVDMKDVN